MIGNWDFRSSQQLLLNNETCIRAMSQIECEWNFPYVCSDGLSCPYNYDENCIICCTSTYQNYWNLIIWVGYTALQCGYFFQCFLCTLTTCSHVSLILVLLFFFFLQRSVMFELYDFYHNPIIFQVINSRYWP